MLEPQCVRNLVRHFADARVGAASGEEIRVASAGTDPVRSPSTGVMNQR